MKLIAFALALFLLLIPSYELSGVPQDTQVKNADLLRLEAKFKQIDEESDSVKVKVTGDKESAGNVNISVEREMATATGGKTQQKLGKTKETLLDIDLSKINVPDEYIDEKMKAAFSTQTRCGTLPGVVVSQIDVSADYVVQEDYTYDSGAYRITVLKGFTYDRASIPRIFWVIIDKDSLGNVAPLLHDLLYRNGGVLPTNQVSPYRQFSRKETDDLFLEVAAKCGVNKWRREVVYQVVRNFGGSSWKEQQPQ
jgi:Protein of unknown function (DUF1353)